MTDEPDLPHAPVPDDEPPTDVEYREKWINRFTAFIFAVLIGSAGLLILALAIRIAKAVAGL